MSRLFISFYLNSSGQRADVLWMYLMSVGFWLYGIIKHITHQTLLSTYLFQSSYLNLWPYHSVGPCAISQMRAEPSHCKSGFILLTCCSEGFETGCTLQGCCFWGWFAVSFLRVWREKVALKPRQEDPILKTARRSAVCATDVSFRRGQTLRTAWLRLLNMASGQSPKRTCRVFVGSCFKFHVVQHIFVFEKITLWKSLCLKMQLA